MLHSAAFTRIHTFSFRNKLIYTLNRSFMMNFIRYLDEFLYIFFLPSVLSNWLIISKVYISVGGA